jgi:four helix bundle protein
MKQYSTKESRAWILEENYDLEERLLGFSIKIIQLTGEMVSSRAGNHVAAQLLRSGTSPFPNHGEAQAAESRKDFVHKLRICLKELRETSRWLRLVKEVPLADESRLLKDLFREVDELTRIFVTSIRTAERGATRRTQVGQS